MATVLITQCLQRDFVDPIGPHDPLPNLLHVGYSEAARLLGPEPAAGPLAQLIEWARGLPSDAIDLVHIRDWHDPDDPAQREHLARFGPHCIKDTIGARLVLEMDEWAEAVPFKETRGYVQGVVRNRLQYQRLYDAQGKFRPVVGTRAVTRQPSAGATPAEPQNATVRKRRVRGNENEE